MKRIAAALFFLLAPFSAAPAFATELQATWGVEDWECGLQYHYLQLGNGSPLHITRMVGVITGGPLPGAAITGSNTRQTLLSITHSGATIVPPATIVGTPPSGSRWSHSVSGNYLNLNLKQTGDNVVAVPFNVTFNDLAVSDGVLRMDVNNLSSNGVTTSCASLSANEMLDTEIHVTIFFTYD